MLYKYTGAISVALGLKLEKTLIIAAIRCLVQLTIMVCVVLIRYSLSLLNCIIHVIGLYP